MLTRFELPPEQWLATPRLNCPIAMTRALLDGKRNSCWVVTENWLAFLLPQILRVCDQIYAQCRPESSKKTDRLIAGARGRVGKQVSEVKSRLQQRESNRAI
jgi:hypothetical protein